MEEHKGKFEVVNIKLQTTKQGEEKKEAYKRLIRELVNNKVHSAVGENKHVILYSCNEKITESSAVEYFYGRIGKGYYFENESSEAIDLNDLKSKKITNDKSKIFDASIAEYVFIPSKHRFCIVLGDKISGNDVKKFFVNALKKVKDKDDVVRVEIQNEPQAIEEIMTAKKVQKIDYVISYTNDDVLGSTASLFDRRLKKSQIGKIEIKAESDHNEHLVLEGEELLEGGIELAKNNGAIKSATIINASGEKKVIKSKETPLRVSFQARYDLFREKIVDTIMSILP